MPTTNMADKQYRLIDDETPEERIERLEAKLVEMYNHQQAMMARGLYEEAEMTRYNIDDTMFELAREHTEVTPGEV